MSKGIFRSKSSRVIAWAAAVIFAFGLAACGAGEDKGGDSGGNNDTTSYKTENVLLIGSAAELNAFSDRVNNGEDFENRHIKLTRDINLEGIAWTTIGHDSNSPFKGHFDGNGKTIFNLSASNTRYESAGLFGRVIHGEIKNLRLENVTVTGDDYVGAVAGYLDSSSVSNCHVTGPGTIQGDSYVGGIAGAVMINSRVSDCYVTSTVKGHHYTGGVAGWVIDSGSSVSNCHVTSNISGGSYIGGIAGVIEEGGSVKNCYATGPVRGINYIGGVAGDVIEGTVTNCYTTGYLDGYNFAGGIAGSVSSSSSSIVGCVALNPAIERTPDNLSNTAFGRVAGHVYGKALNNNMALDTMWVVNAATTKTITNNPDGINGQDITREDAIKQGSYITSPLSWGVGNDNPWKWGGTGYPLPILYWQTEAQLPTSLPQHLQ